MWSLTPMSMVVMATSGAMWSLNSATAIISIVGGVIIVITSLWKGAGYLMRVRAAATVQRMFDAEHVRAEYWMNLADERQRELERCRAGKD